MNNILAVVAHPDDLEMMAGGSIIKWISEGKNIHVLVLTNGSWTDPQGNLCRTHKEIESEIIKVKQMASYSTYEILNEETLNLQFKDSLVCEVLSRIENYGIDTIITSWESDTHRDHRISCEIAKSASRRVPNFIMGQINYYLLDTFAPNMFVDITDTFDTKLQLMSMYRSQWERSGKDWSQYLDSLSICNGKIVGVERAESFIVKRLLF